MRRPIPGMQHAPTLLHIDERCGMRVRQALLQQAGAPGPAAEALDWPTPQPPAVADAQLQAVGSGAMQAASANALYPSPYPSSGGGQAWALPLAAAGIGVAGALLAATAISCITLAAWAARRAGRNDRSISGLGSGHGATGLAAGAVRGVSAIGEGRSLCSASSSDAQRKGRDPGPSPTSSPAGLRFGMDQQNPLPGARRPGSGRGSLPSAALNAALTPYARATAARTAHTDHVPGPLPDLAQPAGPSLGFSPGSGFRPQAARLPYSAWLQPPTPPGDPCITPFASVSPAACPGMAPMRPLTRSGSGPGRGLGSVNSLPSRQPAGAWSALEHASGSAKGGTRGFDELDMWQNGGNPGSGGYLRAPAIAVNLPPSPFVALTSLPFEG